MEDAMNRVAQSRAEQAALHDQSIAMSQGLSPHAAQVRYHTCIREVFFKIK